MYDFLFLLNAYVGICEWLWTQCMEWVISNYQTNFHSAINTQKNDHERDFVTTFGDVTYNANGLMVLHYYNVFCVEACNFLW